MPKETSNDISKIVIKFIKDISDSLKSKKQKLTSKSKPRPKKTK